MSALRQLVHATCLSLGGAAVLLRGASGTGKSDLALRMIGMPAPPLFAKTETAFELVADDQVLLEASPPALFASPPEAIAGKLEIRGVDIVDVPYVKRAAVRLIVDFAAFEDVPRLPADPPVREDILGISLPRITLDPGQASAPLKIWFAMQYLR